MMRDHHWTFRRGLPLQSVENTKDRGNGHRRVVGNRFRAGRAGRILPQTLAITFSSTAIGVGRLPTSMVVRVGLGLPSPAKCSP